MVLDLVGGDTFAGSLRAVARAGHVVALANVALAPSTIDTRDFYPRNVHIHGFQITDLMEHGYDPRPDLRELLTALDTGRFTVPVDTTLPARGRRRRAPPTGVPGHPRQGHPDHLRPTSGLARGRPAGDDGGGPTPASNRRTSVNLPAAALIPAVPVPVHRER